jgi:AcrR family transcriptional regulator
MEERTSPVDAATTARVARRRVVKPPQTRRDELVAAAVGCFKRRGFHETTVGDIAAAAGMATGTVYLYFPSKDHILLECHRRLREGMVTRMAAAAAAAMEPAVPGQPVDLPAVVDAMVDAAAAHAVASRDLCEVCTRYVPSLERLGGDPLGFIDPLVEIIQRGTREGQIQVADPVATAHLLGVALGAGLCSAVAYGAPALDRVRGAAKELVRRTLVLPAAWPGT